MSDYLSKFKKRIPNITKVIQQDKATIIFWEDGTKTVSKCQPDDYYNSQVGFLYALLFKVMDKNDALKLVNSWEHLWKDVVEPNPEVRCEICHTLLKDDMKIIRSKADNQNYYFCQGKHKQKKIDGFLRSRKGK